MSELNPVSITPVNVSVSPGRPAPIATRVMNLSGAPMPEDMRSMIVDHFGPINMDEEALDIVYQYVLSKADTGDAEDMRRSIEAIASRLEPNKQELFNKIRDLAVNELALTDPMAQVEIKRDIISKEMPAIERQAQETGDWRFYLRASKRLEDLSEISNPS
jgi:hypothetical protein